MHNFKARCTPDLASRLGEFSIDLDADSPRNRLATEHGYRGGEKAPGPERRIREVDWAGVIGP